LKKRIYIAGPMSQGDRLDNLTQALEAYRALVRMGYAPLCPQLTTFVGEIMSLDHATWLSLDLPWVAAADGVLRLFGPSKGADTEEAKAKEHNVPVFYRLTDLDRYFGGES
jgi:hypothetical protein